MQARAHEQLGQLLPRERHKHAYNDALKERFKHLPEVKRILRHRHLPTTIYKVCHHPGLPPGGFTFHTRMPMAMFLQFSTSFTSVEWRHWGAGDMWMPTAC